MKIEMLEPLCFNDIMHMNSFVSYLMRTDADQKWTTKETQYNTISLKDLNGNFKTELFGGEIDVKKKKASYIRKQILSRNFTKNFRMRLYYLEPEDTETVTIDNLFEIVEKCITAIEQDAVKEETICYVMHIDQEHPHIHRIYKKTRGNKNVL